MDQGVLKQLLKNRLRYLKITDCVEALPVLRPPEPGLQPVHPVIEHPWNSALYVAAVEVLYSSEVVAGEPDGLYDETGHVALGMTAEEKQPRSREAAAAVRDVKRVEQLFIRSICIIQGLTEYSAEIYLYICPVQIKD